MKPSRMQWNKVQGVKLCCHWFMEVHFPGTSCNLASLWWVVNPLKQNIKLKFCSEVSSLILFSLYGILPISIKIEYSSLLNNANNGNPTMGPVLQLLPNLCHLLYSKIYLLSVSSSHLVLNVFHWNCLWRLLVTFSSLIKS